MGASDAFGQPTGAQVIQGQAQLQQQGNSLVVTTQNAVGTNRSVINWQSFSVPAGSTTRFDQPNAQSLSINRVVGNDPSAIFGTLSSNGRLVLVNPAGIAVGAGAVVDTAGFTASTLRLSEADALAGRLVFGGDGLGGGPLKVDGNIVARSGDVVLIAPQVQTGAQALVQAPNGATVLAAGQKVELTGRGLEGITLQVQAPADQAVNLGTLQGDAVGIFAGQLKHSGLIQATAVTAEGGKILLRASGDNIVDGQITAVKGDKGGSVDLLGQRVGLMANAAVDASGAAGGGTVRIGGDYQGATPDVQNAQRTYVDAAATIRADATQNGNGGKVIVWADDQTQSFGTISARGGAQGGDGGFVEVSGKRRLQFDSNVDTRAPQGKTGTLLLDPDTIEIVTGGTDTFTTGTTIAFADAPGAGMLIDPSTIAGALTNVELQANQGITFTDAVSMVNPGVGLTARAGGVIGVHAPITTKGGAITLSAGDPGTTLGPDGAAIYVSANLDTTGGGAFPNGALITLTSPQSDVGGTSLLIYSNGNINGGTAGNVNISGQDIDIQGASITGKGVYVSADSNNVTIAANALLAAGANGVSVSAMGPAAGTSVLNSRLTSTNGGSINVESWSGKTDITGSTLNSNGGSIYVNAGQESPTLVGDAVVVSGSIINAGAGSIQFNGDSLSGYGIKMPSAAISGGDITLRADRMALPVLNNSINATGVVTVMPASASRPIDLGSSTDAAAALELSQAEVNSIGSSATVLRIGDATAGPINISSLISRAGALSLETSGTITQASSALLGASKLVLKATGGVTLNEANQVSSLSVGAGTMYVSFRDGAYPLDLAAADVTGYVDVRSADRLVVSGPVSSGTGVRLESGSGNYLWVQSSVSGGTGPIQLQSGSHIDLTGVALTTSNAPVTITGPGAVNLSSASITTGGGAISIQGGGPTHTGDGVRITGNSVLNAGTGNVTIDGESQSYHGVWSDSTAPGVTISGANVSITGRTSPGYEAIYIGSQRISAASSVSIYAGIGDLYIPASTITAGGGGISLGSGTADVIVNGGATLGSSGAISVNALDTVFLNSISIDSGGLSLVGNYINPSFSSIVTHNAPVSMVAAGGQVSINSSSISSGNGDITITAGGPALVAHAVMISGNSVLSAGTGDVSIYGETQTGDGVIANSSAAGLTISGANVSISGKTSLGSGYRAIYVGGQRISGSQSVAMNAENGDFYIDTSTITAGAGGLSLSAIGGTSYVEASASTLQSTSNVVVQASGASISQFGGGITAAGLMADGVAVSLSGSNNVQALSGRSNAGDFKFNNVGTGALDIGSVAGVDGIQASGGVVEVKTAGQLKLTQVIASDAPSGSNAITLVASDLLTSGAGALQASNDRWAVFLQDPTSNLVGSPVSGNLAVWYRTFNGDTATSLPETGSRYVFTYQPQVTITAPSPSKTYDGTDSFSGLTATVTGIPDANLSGNVFNQDTVTATLNPLIGYKNVGTYVDAIQLQTVTQSNAGYAPNYVAGTAQITQAPLTITAASDSRTYNATTNSAATPTVAGLYGSDSVSGLTQTFDSKNAGARTLSVGGGFAIADGNGGGNYAVTTIDAAGSITQAPLTITAASDSRTYNATTNSAATPTVAGLYGSDSVSGLTQTFNSKNAGARTLAVNGGYTVNDGNGGANYTVTLSAAPGTITPATLTLTGLSANDKVYDGGSGASLGGAASLSGVLGVDVVTVGGYSAAFADKNVGTAKPVTINGAVLGGADAGNYLLAAPATLSADITPATLTLAGLTANNKVYDAGTGASLSGTASLSGVLGTDVVTVSGYNAAFADKNVGTAKPVTLSGAVLAGTDANNYVLAAPATLAADITPATAFLTGLTANDKVYDATTTATLSGSAMLSGVFATDTVTLVAAPTASFADKNVGTNKPVTVNASTLLSGPDAGNYVLVPPTGLSASITPAPLTVAAINQNKQVGGTFSFTGSEIAVAGLQGGEQVNSAALSSTGAPQDAAYGNHPILVGGPPVGGNGFAAANYQVTYKPGTLVVSNVDTPATQQVNNQVVTFMQLFVQEKIDGEKDKPKGEPDIVLTETACKPQ